MYLASPGPKPVPAPSSRAGLYIHPRQPAGQPRPPALKVSIPPDCLGMSPFRHPYQVTDGIAFQTGEALELLTAGKLAATPHFVSGNAGGGNAEDGPISRETFAFFLQYVTLAPRHFRRRSLTVFSQQNVVADTWADSTLGQMWTMWSDKTERLSASSLNALLSVITIQDPDSQTRQNHDEGEKVEPERAVDGTCSIVWLIRPYAYFGHRMRCSLSVILLIPALVLPAPSRSATPTSSASPR